MSPIIVFMQDDDHPIFGKIVTSTRIDERHEFPEANCLQSFFWIILLLFCVSIQSKEKVLAVDSLFSISLTSWWCICLSDSLVSRELTHTHTQNSKRRMGSDFLIPLCSQSFKSGTTLSPSFLPEEHSNAGRRLCTPAPGNSLCVFNLFHCCQTGWYINVRCCSPPLLIAESGTRTGFRSQNRKKNEWKKQGEELNKEGKELLAHIPGATHSLLSPWTSFLSLMFRRNLPNNYFARSDYQSIILTVCKSNKKSRRKRGKMLPNRRKNGSGMEKWVAVQGMSRRAGVYSKWPFDLHTIRSLFTHRLTTLPLFSSSTFFLIKSFDSRSKPIDRFLSMQSLHFQDWSDTRRQTHASTLSAPVPCADRFLGRKRVKIRSNCKILEFVLLSILCVKRVSV